MKYPALLALAALAACNQPASRLPSATTVPAAAPAPVAPTSTINTPQAKALLARPGTRVLDVRTPQEYAEGHLAGAQNLDVNDDRFSSWVVQLDSTQPYVLYCHSGRRSARAANIMYRNGFRHVVNGGAYDSLKQR